MGKVNRQMSFMCGMCKNFFSHEKAVKTHIHAKHTGHRVSVYRAVSSVDLRGDREESFADRAVAARLAIAMGEHTDDAWLLGE